MLSMFSIPLTPADLTKGNHQTFKQLQNGTSHYVVVVSNKVVASLKLCSALCGNYWVMYSVSAFSNQGYGFALYQLVMQDVYPLGIMPSRECTSGYAVSLWTKLLKQKNIKQTPVVNSKVYCDEFDEWLDEIIEANPDLDENKIELLEKNCSYLSAVQQGLMKPHPYNSTYHLLPDPHLHIIEIKDATYFKESAELFDIRYNTLDT